MTDGSNRGQTPVLPVPRLYSPFMVHGQIPYASYPPATRSRPTTRATSAPSPTARPNANVVRVVTRFPARQTAPMIAPATGRDTAVRFNNAAKSATLTR